MQLSPYFDSMDDINTKELWVIPVRRMYSAIDNRWSCSGLMVLPAKVSDSSQRLKDGNQARIFRRIGCFITIRNGDVHRMGWDREWCLDGAMEVELV